MNNLIGIVLGVIGIIMSTQNYKDYIDSFTVRILSIAGIVLGYAAIFGNVVTLIVKG